MKVKENKRFDHDRVYVAQACLNQPQMYVSLIRGINHNWDETRVTEVEGEYIGSFC